MRHTIGKESQSISSPPGWRNTRTSIREANQSAFQQQLDIKLTTQFPFLLVGFSHGLQIYDCCTNAVEPLWVKGAGHNDIEQFKSYFERLLNFMNHDLKDKWHEEVADEKKKLRMKFGNDFEEIQSNDELNISLTISKSSSASQVDKLDKDKEEPGPSST